ncbi:hybrid sensor histidine kinase/response regulator [Sinobacterium caligoides]|nr:hybrid sensor histidine kinase/response regulator [Sinobacterium caligoides]
MCKTFYTIITLLLSLFGVFSHAGVIALEDGQSYVLSPELEYSVDSSGAVTAQQLYTDPTLLNFRPLLDFATPATKEVVWFRVSLQNTEENQQDYIINFNDVLFEELELNYLLQGELVQQRAGLNYAFSQWPIQHQFVAMPLTIAAGDSIELYFKIYTTNTPLIYPVISSTTEFAVNTSKSLIISLLFLGVGFGICIFMAIFVPIAMPNAQAYGFLVYLVLSILTIMGFSGVFQYLLDDSPEWHKFLMIVLLGLNFISMMAMVNLFFRVYQLNRWLHGCYLSMSATVLITISCYYWLGGYETMIRLMVVMIFSVYVLLIFTSVLKIYQGYPNAGRFLFAMVIYFCSCSYAIFASYGYLPYSPLIRHSVGFGIIIQSIIVCWTIAVMASVEKERALKLAQEVAIAKAASQEKSDLLATMSHEIRTPVNGVLGMAQMLESTQQSVQQAHFTRVILNSGNMLLAVISDILDFSKIEAGKMELEHEPFNLRAVADYTETIFTSQSLSKSIEFTVHLADDCPVDLCGDTIRLQQVLNNLLSNAFKFTERGKINVYMGLLSRQEDRVMLIFSIFDTGIGIAKPMQSQLFDAFVQADRSTTRTYGGTGLGLSISQRLVRMMGGKIGVNSELGRGSEFWFTASFQLVSDRVAYRGQEALYRGSTQSSLSTEAGEGAEIKLLVAEDNPVNQQVIIAMLNKLGVVPTMVDDGQQALEQYQRQSPVLKAVIMDLEMPHKDGYAATREIRQLEQRDDLPAIPIIAITANVMDDNILRCYEAGMNEVLTKPVRLVELERVLKKFAVLEVC